MTKKAKCLYFQKDKRLYGEWTEITLFRAVICPKPVFNKLKGARNGTLVKN